MRTSSLLNAADSALQHEVPFRAFQQSLVLNILFQPLVLINDSFLMTSGYVMEHVQQASATESLLEAALRTGILIPAYRDSRTQDLQTALERIVALYGKEFFERLKDRSP